MAGHSTPSRLYLPCRQTTATRRFEAELSEADFTAALCKTTVTAFMHFAEFCTFWLQHLALPLSLISCFVFL
jgi:hypothetical protein